MFGRELDEVEAGLRLFVILVIGLLLPAIACPQGQPSPSSDIPAQYRQFFKKYKKDGRSLPTSILAAQGIDDHKIGRSYALVAGISHYPHLPSDKQLLQPAQVDVDRLVDFLENHEYFDEIVVLENDDVTLDNLNYFLGEYFPDRMAGDEPNSRFLFAFSGHGFDYGNDSYLLASSASTMEDRHNSIDLLQLKVAVEKSVAKALNVLVLVNSCQGGAFLDKVPFGEKPSVFPKIGAHAITAGAKGQFTYAAGGAGRGSYFFEEVLRALNGDSNPSSDGFLSHDQLYSIVRREVQQDTKGYQEPLIGDIEPYPNQGSGGGFFFVVPKGNARATATPVQDDDCLGALQLDYYDYALANSLQDDFLRSLDQDSWQRLKTVGVANSVLFREGKSFLGGNFFLTDDYVNFDQKRSEHLRNVFYSRSRDQALSILQQTVATREYHAYNSCMQGLLKPFPLFNIWATRETLDEIDLTIGYSGQNDLKMSVKGTIEGGKAVGAPHGSLWDSAPTWSTAKREHHFVINRDPHVAQTTVTVTIANVTSMPFVKTFKRADAVLVTTYSGSAELPAPTKRRLDGRTPDNNENRGHCPNEVGHHDGKYCTSRTTLTLTTTAPHLFKNANIDCAGGGCPWGAAGPATISADGLTASGYVDNWGSSITATLTADEYETISASQCGADSAVPVTRQKPVLIGIRKECLPLALIRWTVLPDMSYGLFHFGEKEPTGGQVTMNGAVVQSDTALFASYGLKSAEAKKTVSFPNSVWKDPATGLLWADTDNGSNINWNEANEFCSNQLKIGDYFGWRLPDINELKSLYDESFDHPYIYSGDSYNGFTDGAHLQNHVKAGVQLNSCCAWSSTSYNSNEAFYLRFQSGEEIHYPRQNRGVVRAICVQRP